MMKTIFLLILPLLILAQDHTDGVGLVIGGGGFGGGADHFQVVTGTKICLGDASIPTLPITPMGSIEGWVSEYVDDKVYLCGGADINFEAECYSFIIGQDFWNYSGTFADGREYASSIVFNEEMVVMGGYNDRNGWLDSVCKKTAGTDEWVNMSEWTMPKKRVNFCAAAMDSNRIIIVGGNEYGAPYADLVSVLDTTSNSWTQVASLAVGTASLGCLTVNYNGEQGLLVTGGCINQCQNHLDTASFLSYSSLTWTDLPALNEARMGHKMTWIDGQPAVIGGYATDIKRSVELWNGTQWVLHQEQLIYGVWSSSVPSYVPMSELTCP